VIEPGARAAFVPEDATARVALHADGGAAAAVVTAPQTTLEVVSSPSYNRNSKP